jgi:hypothetical protein
MTMSWQYCNSSSSSTWWSDLNSFLLIIIMTLLENRLHITLLLQYYGTTLFFFPVHGCLLLLHGHSVPPRTRCCANLSLPRHPSPHGGALIGLDPSKKRRRHENYAPMSSTHDWVWVYCCWLDLIYQKRQWHENYTFMGSSTHDCVWVCCCLTGAVANEWW